MIANLTLCSYSSAGLPVGIASAVSATALGIGIRLLLPILSFPAALVVVLLGIAIHGAGVVSAHKTNSTAALEPPEWLKILKWMCWLVWVGLTPFGHTHLSKTVQV